MTVVCMMEGFTAMLHTQFFWIASVVALIWMYFKFVLYTYWKRKGIPYDEPITLFGSALPLVTGKLSIGNLVKQKYLESKKYPLYGFYIFHEPILLVNDPDLIRLVLVKEYNKFRDRSLYYNEEVDPLTTNIFQCPGDRWKRLRPKISMTFTSSKLKQVFPLLMECANELERVCGETIKTDSIVEIKDLIARYTIDTISSLAFGFNCDSLNNPDNEFRKYGGLILDMNPIKFAMATFTPGILDTFRIPFLPKKTSDFFRKTIQDEMENRHRNQIVRKDIINLLMQLMDYGVLEEDEDSQKNGSPAARISENNKITLVEAQAQAFAIFLAGYETASTTVTCCLYELARHPDIQEKVRAEIDENLAKPDRLTYERVVNEFEYLQMVYLETLRLHPTLPILNRRSVEDCDLPDFNVRIEKGTTIMVSVSGVQRDPDIYPDPDKFDPLRFSKENVTKRNNPYAFLAFGDGPRHCIGARLGTLQVKTALVSLLAKYRFSLCEKTKIPMPYTKRSLTQTPAGGIYLKIEKRTK